MQAILRWNDNEVKINYTEAKYLQVDDWIDISDFFTDEEMRLHFFMSVKKKVKKREWSFEQKLLTIVV